MQICYSVDVDSGSIQATVLQQYVIAKAWVLRKYIHNHQAWLVKFTSWGCDRHVTISALQTIIKETLQLPPSFQHPFSTQTPNLNDPIACRKAVLQDWSNGNWVKCSQQQYRGNFHSSLHFITVCETLFTGVTEICRSKLLANSQLLQIWDHNPLLVVHSPYKEFRPSMEVGDHQRRMTSSQTNCNLICL